MITATFVRIYDKVTKSAQCSEISPRPQTQLAFSVNLHRAIIGPSATLTGRWRPDIDLRRMLTGNVRFWYCLLLKMRTPSHLGFFVDISTNPIQIIRDIEYWSTWTVGPRIDVSDCPLRYRSPIFPKTDSPYDNSFWCTLSEYSEFYKTLFSLVKFRKKMSVFIVVITYIRTSMVRTSLGRRKFILDMGSSNHWGLIIAPS